MRKPVASCNCTKNKGYYWSRLIYPLAMVWYEALHRDILYCNSIQKHFERDGNKNRNMYNNSSLTKICYCIFSGLPTDYS